MAIALVAVAAPALAQDGLDDRDARAPEAAPFTPRDAAERIAPQTGLDWRALEDLDARTYLGRLAALDRLAVSASEMVLARDPRPRTTDVARDILEAHEAGRAIVRETLPETFPEDIAAAPVQVPGDREAMAALEAATRPIDFEEIYIDAMIEAHREAVGLTSFYRRFGSDEHVRELARRILPMLEASLYQAVAIRQELVAEFIAVR